MFQINISDFYRESDNHDYTPACVRALAASEKYDQAEIFFEKGEYHVYDDTAEEFFSRICNNDSVMRKALFHVVSRKNLTINGNGSKLITHGRLTPFIIDKCENVTVRDISVDAIRPFYTEARVLDVCGDELTIRIDQEHFPTDVRGENLLFTSDRWECDGTLGTILVQEFDPATGAPAVYSRTSLAAIGDGVQNTENLPVPLWRLRAVRLSDDKFVLKGKRTYDPKVGNVLVMTHEIRSVGGMLIFDSKDITAKNVTIYQSAAMPFLAQFTENVTIDGCTVTPAVGRTISTNTDAAHFVHCTGTVAVENCRFEYMMDDCVNVHGMYTVVDKVEDNKIYLALIHYQQKGINMYRKGDYITVYDKETLAVVARQEVMDSYLPNEDVLVVEVASTAGICSGNIAENIERMPKVVLRRNHCGNNRPRGFVVSTSKEMIIEDNVLYNYQNCIDIPGDAKYWYETGGVRSVVIRNNIFILHNSYQANAAVKVKPDFDCPINNYHQNVVIENNHFFGNNPRLLDAMCVDGLVFQNNTYRAPLVDETGMEVYRIRVANCKNTDIQEVD